jgi:hypothetical protein
MSHGHSLPMGLLLSEAVSCTTLNRVLYSVTRWLSPSGHGHEYSHSVMLAGVVAANDASGTRIKLIGGVRELQNRRRPLVPCRGETFHGACFLPVQS